MASALEVLQGFFSLIRLRRDDAITSYLAGDAYIDDPVLGRFQGPASISMYMRDARIWLSRYDTGIEPVNFLLSDDSAALEYDFRVTVGGRRISLPVALAADLESGKFTGIRIYFSTFPLTGEHQTRSPLLPEDPGIILPKPVEMYMRLLAGSDPEPIVDLFHEEGYVREPSGGEFTYRGRKRLLEFYGPAVSGGGIPLRHCRAITDGASTAVEYFFDKWNGTAFPAQAGIAFYETSDDGRITAARIYDDAEPPF